MNTNNLVEWRFAMFFPRRRFGYMRRPWMFRRRFYRPWGCLGCFPGCLMLALLGLLVVGALVALAI